MTTPDNTVRLSKRMAELGLCSRREADAYIERGWVSVNGEKAVLGQKVGAGDRIELHRAAHEEQAGRVTILLHKPVGFVSGQAEKGYRSAAELDERFGRRHQGEEDPAVGGRYQVESYLDYHAGKLLARFDANTYLIVTHSMMVHDVGTGRGGIEAALARVQARTLVVDVDSDRLFLPAQAEELAGGIPGARRETISSLHGHDGFLIEAEQMDAILRDFLTGA